MTFMEIINDDSEPPEPIIGNGVLLDQTMLVIIGKAKSMKTFLGLNMVLAIASGRPLGNFPIERKATVLYLSAEGGYYPARARIKTIARGIDEEALNRIIYPDKVNYSIDNDASYKMLRKLIENIKPEVLVLDPLIRFHSVDENSSQGMNIIFRRIRELMKDFKLSVIIIHHTGKVVSKGGRGSSVINGEYDSAIYVFKQADHHRFEFDMRHVEAPAPMKYIFNKETLWFQSLIEDESSPVEAYLLANEPISRTELVANWVATDTFSRSRGYKLIKEALKKELITEEEGKLKLLDSE